MMKRSSRDIIHIASVMSIIETNPNTATLPIAHKLSSFGLAFREAATQTSARYKHDGFDHRYI